MAEYRDVVVIGAGGFGREVVDVITQASNGHERLRLLGFLDDGTPDLERLSRRRAALLGTVAWLRDHPASYVAAVGDPSARQAIVGRCDAMGAAAVSVVHPAAVIGGDTSWSDGFIACAHSTITTNVRLGRHVQLHVNATIGHDCRVGDFVTITPGANIAGETTIGDRVWIGSNAAVLRGVTIGDDVVIGAGAVVVDDVDAGVTAVGVPARPLARQRAEVR